MTNQKLTIKKLILKKECAAVVKNFYDPFANFYMLPVVQRLHVPPLLLVNRTGDWARHMVYVSYNNTRQLKERAYQFEELDAFKLHLHLIEQKSSSTKSWKSIQQNFQAPITGSLSTMYFESYALAIIPIDWQELEQSRYENDWIELELEKK